MKLTEAFLFMVGLGICGYSVFTDLRYGIVSNKILAAALVPCLILNGIYYTVYAPELLPVYGVNVLVMAVLSILFYATHIWGGGDSKLLILLSLTVPAGGYVYLGQEALPLLSMVVLIFTFGYVYLAVHSVVCLCRKEVQYKQRFTKQALWQFLREYVTGIVYLSLFAHFSGRMFPVYYGQDQALFMFIHIFLSMLISQVSLFKNPWLILVCALCNIVLGISAGQGVPAGQLWSYLIVAVLLTLRELMARYNYKSISPEQLKPGMILAAADVLLMLPSRIADLPRSTAEDLRCRLSEAQVKAVYKWHQKQKKYTQVTIVRKIPFAVFIALGYLLYVVMGGIL